MVRRCPIGHGGLTRAYGGTAALCLQSAQKTKIVPTVSVTIDVEFSDLALLKARLVAHSGVQLNAEHFTGTGAVLNVAIAEAVADEVIRVVGDLTRGRAVVTFA